MKFLLIFTSMVLLQSIAHGGLTFTDPIIVIDNSGGSCLHPSLAINPDLDRLYVAYDFIPASVTKVMVTYSDSDGASWSTPFDVSATLPVAVNPTVSAERVNGTDIVAVVYQNGNFSARGPAYMVYSIDGGDTFSLPVQVSTSGSDEVISIDAAIRYDSSLDKYIIGFAWSSEMDGGYIGSVRYREYSIDLNGPDSFGTEIDFSSDDDHIGYASDVDLEFDSNGNPHVLFGSYRDAYPEITYSCNTGSGWSDPEVINDNSESFQQINASGRGMTIDADDNIYAAWNDMYQNPLSYFIGNVKLSGESFGTDFDIDDCGSIGDIVGYGTVCAGSTTGNATGAWFDRRYPGMGNCFVGETTDTGANWDRPSVLATPGLDPQTEHFLRYIDVVRDDSENKVFAVYEVAFENYIKMNVGTRSSRSRLHSSEVSATASDGLINVSWIPETEMGISEYRIYQYTSDEITDSAEMLSCLVDEKQSNYDPVYDMYSYNSASSQTRLETVDRQPDVIISINNFSEEPNREYKAEIIGNPGDRILVEAISTDGQVFSFSPVTVLENESTTVELHPAGAAIAGMAASPNPTDGRASFSFELLSAGNVEISVYNLKGQIVAEVADEYFHRGSHSINWESKLTPGVYFYRLSIAGDQMVSKLVIVR